MKFNSCQTEYTEEYISRLPREAQEQYYDFITNVPYIRKMIAPDRPYAKDLNKDSEGKIVVDISNPHILENTDYFRPSALHYEKFGCYTKLRPNSNPNSEYGKWIREEIRRCWEGYVRKSDGEWITGDMYFFLNYCPIQLIKKDKKGKSIRTIGFPRFWDGHYYMSHYLQQCREEGHHAATLAKRGAGKAHPYDEIVYTSTGKKLWKDVKVGDYLFGDDGNLTKVTDIPFDDYAPIYEITLSNGYKVKCSSGHLWKVKSHSRGDIVISTEELLSLYKRPRKISERNPKGYELDCLIPRGNGIELPYKKTKIDPYTFGLLLGNGCFRNKNYADAVLFSADSKDMDIYKDYIPYEIKEHRLYSYSFKIKNIRDILIEYDLFFKKSEDKFIPDVYKYNNRDVRINVLKGLLDTDGTAHKNKIEIVLSSKRLIEDIRWMCASLGIPTSNIRVKHSWYYDKDKNKIPCLTAYRLSIYPSISLFNLPRKLELWENRSMTNYGQSKYRGYRIMDIQYIGIEKAKCVTVDNVSHCYLINNFIVTHNSFFAASMLAKRFILGESKEVNKKVQCVATASERKYIQGANQLLDMFQYYIDFCANNTEFPRQRITNSLQNLAWTMGYVDAETNTRKGTENSVIGVTSKDDESKLRGSRGVLYLLEEAGNFPRLLSLYQILRPSVEDGSNVYGLLYLYGTAGQDDSDFGSMQELMYNPDGYNLKKLDNVYDKEGQGKKYFTYFFPGYMNRADCYDENGNSDVIKALMEILIDRHKVKYNSSNINAISRRISEIPITPQEAILKTKGNIFPITEITQRINEIDNNPSFFNDVYIGNLTINSKGEVDFTPSNDIPIRDFPTKDNKVTGALEIYEMPQKVHDKIPNDRYILSLDNYENDEAQSMSLGSMFVLDLWTDRIVAEYTGRPMFADDLNELCRKLCLFYHGKVMCENNKKNTFAYFSRMNSLHLMADTPEYLKNKQIIKFSGYGNSTKGITATAATKNFALGLIRDWLLKPVTVNEDKNGEVNSYTVTNLNFIKNRALLKELMLFNPIINVDRIMSLCQLMMYREEKMIAYQGNPSKYKDVPDTDYLGNDDFFNQNYVEY
jgi:hypothetical protein